ncbi:MAG: hypothetical protein OEW05_07000, partial [Candidatus Aminicenantes bacterium]|nr:hypothetical protein [Candidatus Aminicenantes bacterium]
MKMSSSCILFRTSVLTVILLLMGEVEPDRAFAKAKNLFVSPARLAEAPMPAAAPGEAKIKQNLSYGNIPLYFVPNQGQVNEAARFYARTSRYTLWLTGEGLVFDRSVSTDKPADWTRPWEREEARGRGEYLGAERPHGEATRAGSRMAEGPRALGH